MELNNIVFSPKITATTIGTNVLPWYHFSVDDVFDSLIEISDSGIPLFEHPIFALFKEMHDSHGMCVGLNLFFQKEIKGRLRTLTEVRDLRDDLKEETWIKFGPHALDFDTAPYNQDPKDQMETFDCIYREIDRFAGKDLRAHWIRLHYYSESYELAEYFAGKGVQALFSTDRLSGSHRMPDDVKQRLLAVGSATYQKANFIRTQFRVEFFVEQSLDNNHIDTLFKQSVQDYGYIIIYTHEYELLRPEVRDMLRTSIKMLSKNSIISTTAI